MELVTVECRACPYVARVLSGKAPEQCPHCHGDLYLAAQTEAEPDGWHLSLNDKRMLKTLLIGSA